MEINIENLHAGESFYEANKILFRLSIRKFLLKLTIPLFGAAYFLITALSSGYDSSESTTTTEESVRTYLTHVTNLAYHLTLGLGIAFSFLLLIQILGFTRQRSRFFTEAKIIRNRYTKSGNKYAVKITEEVVFYQDFELKRESKRSVYANYLFYGNYLFLFPSASYWTAFSIDLSENSPGDLNELRTFLKRRLLEKSRSLF
jgi:hypothetical protein